MIEDKSVTIVATLISHHSHDCPTNTACKQHFPQKLILFVFLVVAFDI